MGRSLTLTGVPKSMSYATFKAMVESLGFDVNDLVSLRFEGKGIYAEVIPRDENGDPLLRRVGGSFGLDTIMIPIEDPEP